MANAADVIGEAIEILRPPGAWCQGNEYLTNNGKKAKKKPIKAHCAIGAVDAVTQEVKVTFDNWDNVMVSMSSEPKRGYVVARREAVKILGEQSKKAYLNALKLHKKDYIDNIYYTYDERISDIQALDPVDAIVDYNDSEFGSKRNVMKVFRDAHKVALQKQK